MNAIKLLSFILILPLFPSPIFSQENNDQVQIKTTKLNDHVFMLEGINGFGGGNITVSVGEDGILLADCMYNWMNQKIRNVLDSIGQKPIRIVLNSHFHRDHIEGNKEFRDQAVIIAHDNVAKRLLDSNDKRASELLPMVTFGDSLNLRFNEEEIKMYHFPNSHTDGDVAIYFSESKVIHLGDLFFFGMFPAVYKSGGGDIEQLMQTIEKILQLIPEDTKIVPGHGNLANKKDLEHYLLMLRETTGLVKRGIKLGQNLDQIKKAKLIDKYGYLGKGGAHTTDQYVEMLYGLLQEDVPNRD